MKKLYYNVNSNVWVKLTPKGRDIYKNFWKEVFKGTEHTAPELHTDDRGWTEFQMWDLMCIFGAHLYNGCEVPFQTYIKFSEKDITKKDPST